MVEHTTPSNSRLYKWVLAFPVANYPDLLAGVAIGAFISTLSVASPVFIIGSAAIVGRVALSRGYTVPVLAMAAGLVLLVSSMGAGLVTMPAAPAIIICFWTFLMVMLYLHPPTAKAFDYLIPFWVLHAVATLIDCTGKVWLNNYWPAQGIADSRNVVAGFMAFGIIYAIHKRMWWLLSVLTIAILPTGSRLATGIVIVITLALVLFRIAPVRTLAIMAASGALVVFVTYDYVPAMYRVSSTEITLPEAKQEFSAIGKIQDDLLGRLGMPQAPSFVPQGPLGATDDAHNVFLRMSIEQGILAAAAWLLLSLWALWRSPRFDMTWWMLLAFMGLTTLEYYPMYPLVISAFWWALVGMRLRNSLT